MNAAIQLKVHQLHWSRTKRFFSTPKSISLLFLLIISTISLKTFSQAGDLSQIRNGNGKVQNNVLDTCGSCWVNGNAGASNAHYTEGMSIAYRSLITGLTAGTCYEYELGYDTYHSAMAIDYLTHFQRLYYHQPFGHQEEVIQPLVMVSGSKTYNMTVVAGGTNTFPIKAPSPSGITSGAFNKDGTPRDVSNQAATSFNNLPANERLMTIYNGVIQAFNYVSQATIVIGGADAETRVRIRFQALSDSVVLAWGGHIASRLDWGYTKDNKGNLSPLSAAGISGSPYHMRQKAFDRVTCNSDANAATVVLQNFSGFGNQDRSLSAAAVIPPPECPTVTSQTKCLESTSFVFTISNPVAGTTYVWSIGSNTANATISGSNSGTSVTIVPAGGGSFTGGSFSLNIAATLNSITLNCSGVATGTVVDVSVSAAASPTTIDLATGSTSALSITSISPGTTADYTYLWKVVSKPANSDASVTGVQADGSATFNVLSPYQQGDYKVRVIATQKSAPNCKDSADVTISVSGNTPNCLVTGPALICPSTTNTYKYDPDNDNTANAIPTNFTAAWTLRDNTAGAVINGSTTGNSVSITVGSACNKSFTIRITLTSTSGLLSTYCEKTVSVNDTEKPVITCPADKTLECGASTLPANTGTATATDNCSATVTYSDATDDNCNIKVITRTWLATDPCGNTATCKQLIIVKDTQAPVITCLSDGNITVTDNCSVAADIVTYYKDDNGTRHWTAVDASGNTATKDCTLPVLTVARTTSNAITETAVQTTVQPTTVQTRIAPAKISAATATLQVRAYPNPYDNTVNFQFVSPIAGKVSLEAYDMLGRKIAVIYQGMVEANAPKTVTYKIAAFRKVPMIYKIAVGGLSARGKLLPGGKE